MDYTGPNLDPRWQAELDALFPPGGSLSWMKVVWVAGDAWEPVHRIALYQMLPLDRANRLVQADLRGPNPRTRGHYDRVLGKFVPDPTCNIDRMQWELYQKTGCYGVMYWIVQGTGGGHKRRFNRKESAISRMHGGPRQPPAIGDLPYAEPDRRTFDKLAKLDLARHYSYLLDRMDAAEASGQARFDAHDRQIQKEMSDQVWKWLEGQVSDVLRDERAGTRELMASGTDQPFDEGAFERAFAEN